MNETEQKAFKWLLKQGFARNEIKFQYNASPDFITPKGGYEAKRLAENKYVVFTEAQAEDFENSDTVILVFSLEKDEPVGVGRFHEIQSKFHCYASLAQEDTVLCRIEKVLLDTYKELHPLKTKRMSYSGVANYVIEQFIKLDEETPEK